MNSQHTKMLIWPKGEPDEPLEPLPIIPPVIPFRGLCPRAVKVPGAVTAPRDYAVQHSISII
jgi:hypothetical protein